MHDFVDIEFKTTDGNWARTSIDESKAEQIIAKLSERTQVKVLGGVGEA